MTSYELGFGSYILCADKNLVAGRFLISLGSITFALFCVIATSMRQIEGFARVWYFPVAGYSFALGVCIWAIVILSTGRSAADIVSGHMVLGAGMIALCVSTIALTSRHFLHIAANSLHKANSSDRDISSYTRREVFLLASIPASVALCGFVYGIYSIALPRLPEKLGGHALMAQSFVCLSLTFIVYILARQMNNTFLKKFKWRFSVYVVINGLINIIWGVCVLCLRPRPFTTPGFGMIGLGLVCISISGKAHRVVGSWKGVSELAYFAAYFPALAGLCGLLLSAILFSAAVQNPLYLDSAYAVSGLAAVCVAIYGIVAIPVVDPLSPDRDPVF
ncbi:MAG: DUF2776 family protein [Aeriscardovia sp.]|nr:DUF2776 family protein [Aeriscardovia sp.]